MVWAIPVTGSSFTPTQGPKKRETKSVSPSPGAVTMTPRGVAPRSILARWPKSGAMRRTSASVATRTTQAFTATWVVAPGAHSRTSSRLWGGGAGMGGSAGKSIWSHPSSAASTSRIPLRVEKRRGGSTPTSRRSTWEVARVAWPQRGTSTVGVNHWSLRIPSPSGGWTKAVSERFISAAIACMVSGGRGSSRRQTPAGFPRKGWSVKASTW